MVCHSSGISLYHVVPHQNTMGHATWVCNAGTLTGLANVHQKLPKLHCFVWVRFGQQVLFSRTSKPSCRLKGIWVNMNKYRIEYKPSIHSGIKEISMGFNLYFLNGKQDSIKFSKVSQLSLARNQIAIACSNQIKHFPTLLFTKLQ